MEESGISGIRYNVYYEDGNFAQMYSLQLGEETALKYAKSCCNQMKGRIDVLMSNGIEFKVYESLREKKEGES